MPYFRKGSQLESYVRKAYASRYDRSPRRESLSEMPRRLANDRYTREWDTYGTYIYPADVKWYHAPDPSACYCNCCPHEPRRHSDQRYPSLGRSWDAGPERGRPIPSARRQPDAWKSRSAGSVSRVVLDVVDKTDGPLRLAHGPNFRMSVSPRGSVHDVVSFLAPDRHRQKVMVRWKDGSMEPFDRLLSLDEVLRHAKELVVKDKKSVHWRS